MQTIINFFRGSVRFTADGPFPERFLNARPERVSFWGWVAGGGAVKLTVAHQDWKRARAWQRRPSAPSPGRGKRASFLGRFRRRYALLVGLFLSLATVCILSGLHFDRGGGGTPLCPPPKSSPRCAALASPRHLWPRVDEGHGGPAAHPPSGVICLLCRQPKGTVAQVWCGGRQGTELLDKTILGDVVAKNPIRHPYGGPQQGGGSGRATVYRARCSSQAASTARSLQSTATRDADDEPSGPKVCARTPWHGPQVRCA